MRLKLLFMVTFLNMKAKTIFITAITVILLLIVLIQLKNNKRQTVRTSAAPPVVIPTIDKSSNVMDSPDGTMSLTLDKNGSTYSVFISLFSTSSKNKIFYKVEGDAQKLEIPYNTWSPDNKYVFLKEKTASGDNYFVLQSSGNLFSNGSLAVEIRELFQKNILGYTIEDVTGWGGQNLLIINTRSEESGQKVSFWFETTSLTFIQLGTYFK